MGQELFNQLSNRLSNRFSIDSSGMTTTDWVVANTTLNGKPFSISGYEFQRKIMDDMHTNMSCVKCSQVGLALALDTPVITADGWKTMGTLNLGDKLYDELGNFCTVTYLSPIYNRRECYEIRFDDGTRIIADAKHRWPVKSRRAFNVNGEFQTRTGAPPEGYAISGVLSTKTLAESHGAFYIPTTAPLVGAISEPPFEAYEEGVRLGKGTEGVIPQSYLLKSSIGSRLELLQGIMDSSGVVALDGVCYLDCKNAAFLETFQELVHSLGLKTRARKTKIVFKISGVDEDLKFPKDLAQALPSKHYSSRKHRIVSVSPIDSVPVRCITVDSPNHLYLVGKSMIPTHNTELQIRSTLALLIRRQGTSAIFSLPTDDMYERVSKVRIKPIIDHNQVFNTTKDRMNKAVRTTGLMQFGSSYLYIVAATETAATSVPADAVINDELDLSDQKMIALFNSRMQNSDLKLSRKFSTPTFPGHGVDLHWQHSDQHHYLVRCPSCNHWQHPEFNRDFIHLPGLSDDIEDLSQIDAFIANQLDLKNSYVKCEKCHRQLNLIDPELREWVPYYPSRVNSRGFRVSPFCTSKLDVEYIIKQLLDYRGAEYMRGWWNTVLGLPYSDASIQIPIAAIRSCMKSSLGQKPGDGDPVYVGIDVGQTCHLVLGSGTEAQNIFHFETLHVDNLLTRVQEILKEYNIVAGGIDRYPYTPTSNDIFELSEGKIVPIEYSGDAETSLVRDPYGAVTHARVNRTMALDRVMTKVKKRELELSGYGEKKQVIEDHLRDMVRDESPDQKVKWIKLKGNDHFFHAMGYLLVSTKVSDLIKYKDDTDRREMSLIQELEFAVEQAQGAKARGLFGNSFGSLGIIGYNTGY